MTSDERQQTVDFLRQLAEWLEDGEELERQYGVDWQPIRPSFFESLMAWKDRVRIKPKPLEGWLVLLEGRGTIYCESENDVARAVDANRAAWIRTVHLREVQ
jgi:hypothetical protein